MRHMATVSSRQSDHCSFDERADMGDPPQNPLAPRHEPILGLFYGIHSWTVLLRANISNTKRACNNVLLAQAPVLSRLASSRRLFSLFPCRPRCDNSRFLKGCAHPQRPPVELFACNSLVVVHPTREGIGR